MTQGLYPKKVLEETLEILTNAEEACFHYQTATGMPCYIMDKKGNPVIIKNTRGSNVCSICNNLNPSLNSHEGCKEHHVFSAKQSEIFGGTYIYFCLINLVYWVSPFFYNGQTLGYLLGGPATIIEREELKTDIFNRFPKIVSREEYLDNLLKKIPFLGTKKIKSLAEMLLITSNCISSSEASFKLRRDVISLQSKISEEIHEQKKKLAKGIEVPFYPIEKERELLSAIKTADKERGRKILNELLGAIYFTSGGKFEVVKYRILELLVLLSRAALEGGADLDQSLELNLGYIKEIDNFHNLEDLSVWLGKVLNHFINLVFLFREVKHLGAIERAVQYIHLHLLDKVNLEDAADSAGLSPPYFSSIFKKEMGVGFTQYLSELRIRVAQRLLLESNLTLSEIAVHSGFEDQSYFTRTFKKITGTSPGRYRENKGRPSGNWHTL